MNVAPSPLRPPVERVLDASPRHALDALWQRLSAEPGLLEDFRRDPRGTALRLGVRISRTMFDAMLALERDAVTDVEPTHSEGTPGVVPAHVAIIMDGNGRWATRRRRPRSWGHVEGANAATRTYRAARALGVRHLTLYGFSTANFERPQDEVATIMRLFAEHAASQRDDFVELGIRFEIIGDLERVPDVTRRSLEATMAATADGSAMQLSIAIAYGARTDLVSAVRSLCEQSRNGRLAPEDVDDALLRQSMWTHDLPDVDLLIRTGGEQRLSDFLLVENAYAELLFDDTMWPDYRAEHLRNAIAWFAGRQRRFGAVPA
ncbi:MAG: polyprenyl diphosphate synthase [Deltaproteobacteria bacterium]|jgi:undecaprenyl diphosphate synthase